MHNPGYIVLPLLHRKQPIGNVVDISIIFLNTLLLIRKLVQPKSEISLGAKEYGKGEDEQKFGKQGLSTPCIFFICFQAYRFMRFISISICFPCPNQEQTLNVRLPIGISGLILADKTNNTQKKFLKGENIVCSCLKAVLNHFILESL